MALLYSHFPSDEDFCDVADEWADDEDELLLNCDEPVVFVDIGDPNILLDCWGLMSDDFNVLPCESTTLIRFVCTTLPNSKRVRASLSRRHLSLSMWTCNRKTKQEEKCYLLENLFVCAD